MLLMVKRMLSIMGIVELLRAAKCCTWYNVLLLNLIAAAVCMRRLPYYTEILLFVWVLAIVAFALFMSRMKEIHSIGFWHILPCALMLPIFFYSAVEIRRWPQGLAVLIFVTLGCTVNDVGAYFVGRAVGTHKLAPIISPGKTVEGGLGGMVSSVILMGLIASLYCQCAGVDTVRLVVPLPVSGFHHRAIRGSCDVNDQTDGWHQGFQQGSSGSWGHSGQV